MENDSLRNSLFTRIGWQIVPQIETTMARIWRARQAGVWGSGSLGKWKFGRISSKNLTLFLIISCFFKQKFWYFLRQLGMLTKCGYANEDVSENVAKSISVPLQKSILFLNIEERSSFSFTFFVCISKFDNTALLA